MATDSGYNIPVSISNATTSTLPISIGAQTTFNFSSPYATGGYNSTQANPIAPATATSSAALGNAAASSSGSGVGTGLLGALTPTGTSTTSSNLLLYAAIAAAVWFGWKAMKHKAA